jgi:hypothetical protein
MGDRLVVTFGTFDKLPRSEKEAVAAGWVDIDRIEVELDRPACVDNHGRHFVKLAANPSDPAVAPFAGKPVDFITLLMNSKGNLMGLEFSSLSRQPSPPWEHSPKGHPDMGFEHWHMHIYFSDPTKAC